MSSQSSEFAQDRSGEIDANSSFASSASSYEQTAVSTPERMLSGLGEDPFERVLMMGEMDEYPCFCTFIPTCQFFFPALANR